MAVVLCVCSEADAFVAASLSALNGDGREDRPPGGHGRGVEVERERRAQHGHDGRDGEERGAAEDGVHAARTANRSPSATVWWFCTPGFPPSSVRTA